MRVSNAFLKDVVNAPNADQIMEIKYNGKIIKMRVLLYAARKKPGNRSKMLKRIMEQILNNIIPIRPGRSFEIRMTVRSNKNSLNKKRTL